MRRDALPSMTLCMPCHDIDPRAANVVELRFFGGLTVEETAQALGISDKTVMRDWELAKVWLLHELKHKG